jgi:hypothetical protein
MASIGTIDAGYPDERCEDADVAIHLVLATTAAVALVATVGAALLGAAGRTGTILVDRLILVSLAMLALAAASGLLPFAAEGPPRDPLHYLYAVAGPVALLAGRFVGTRPTPRGRASLVALGSAVALALVVRSFMTGA